MDSKEQLIQGIRALTKAQIPDGVMLAKVLAVDEEAGTADVESLDGLRFYDARLSAQVPLPSSALLVLPAVGSWVGAVALPGDVLLVVSYSEIDKVVVTVGTSVFEVDSAGIKIEHGESLKTLIGDLIAQIKLITVTTPSGPSTLPLLNAVAFDTLKTRFDNVLK